MKNDNISSRKSKIPILVNQASNMAATSVAFLLLLPLTFLILPTPLNAANFTIVNHCPFTVWPAAVPFGNGIQLDSGQAWSFTVPALTTGKVWPRTGCSFDASGNGSCQTGDCGGKLRCTTYGSPPNTLAEFSLNQDANLDFFDISLVDGYNVGLSFGPATPSGNSSCRDIRCAAAEIIEQCPGQLTALGGCNNPCWVFQTNRYCCTSESCKSTWYSRFFKYFCPDAFSYPMDDQRSSFGCYGGADYRVTFCPN